MRVKSLLLNLIAIPLALLAVNFTFSISGAGGLGDPYPPLVVERDVPRTQNIRYPDGYDPRCNRVYVFCVRSEDGLAEYYADEWYQENITHVIDLISML